MAVTFSRPLMRVGRGVWGEGRDLRSLALPQSLFLHRFVSRAKSGMIEAGNVPWPVPHPQIRHQAWRPYQEASSCPNRRPVQPLTPPRPRTAPAGSREICLFNEIATITAHTQDLQEIAHLTLETVLDFFRIEAGLLLVWDHNRQRLTSVAAHGFRMDYLHWTGTGELEKMIGPYLSRATQPLVMLDVKNDPRLATSTFSEAIRNDPRFQAVVSIPLKYREEVNGFLNLAGAAPEAFQPYQDYLL